MYGLLLIVFIPFEIYPCQQAITDLLFKKTLTGIADWFYASQLINPEISSDSSLLYLLVILLLPLSFAFSLLIHSIPFLRRHPVYTYPFHQKLFSYYLAIILFKYGFDKIFKGQFYLPEPNLLYTPFGLLDQDILYWSTMGTSYSYNLFLGGAELLAASLLLFNRSRVAGLVLSFFILINVFAVNLCFDISVKLFSLVLLYLNFIALSPFARQFYDLFILRKTVEMPAEPRYPAVLQTGFVKYGLKTILVSVILAQTLLPYLQQNRLNDDETPRPYLHGAYEVSHAKLNGDSTAPGLAPVKRFFIHRAGFIIFQDQKDAMEDYKLEIDKTNSQLLLTDYELQVKKFHYTYTEKDSSMELQYFHKGHEYLLKAKALDWRKMPALQSQFHLSMDNAE